MSLFNAIKTLFTTKDVKNLENANDEAIEFEIVLDEVFEKHQELLKESTQLKKDGNLNEAINIIYKAIEKYPIEDDSKSYFKIAYYYQLQKNWDESWKIYQKVLDTLNPNDPIQYTNLISDIFDEQVKHLKREKNLSEYLYHYSLSEFTTLVYRAMNGVETYVKNFYENIDTYYDIKLLKNEELKNEYIKLNRQFVESKKESIYNLLDYTKDKTYQMMDDDKLKKLLENLHHLECSNFYNENISNKMAEI